jgi:hypothetical protein
MAPRLSPELALVYTAKAKEMRIALLAVARKLVVYDGIDRRQQAFLSSKGKSRYVA